MRFQERDGRLLETIYDYDGLVARRHLKELFWPEATGRAMEKRLSLLYHNGYLDWPDAAQRRSQPVAEPVVWLGWRGIAWLAGQWDAPVPVVDRPTETGLRRLECDLRREGIHWRREPRWNQMAHDLTIVDFRIAVQRAVDELPGITLEEWVAEGVFWREPETIRFAVTGSDGRTRQRTKSVRPDGVFVVVDTGRQSQGLPARARFLLEVDNATHDNPRFGREKVAPGIAYLKSAVYKARFGEASGRWLVVTRGNARRLANLMSQTRQTGGEEAGLFFFTTAEQAAAVNVLTAPIWLQTERTAPVALMAFRR